MFETSFLRHLEMLEVDPSTMVVREHIEGVVEKLIVGTLDNAAVGKIFRDEMCTFDNAYVALAKPQKNRKRRETILHVACQVKIPRNCGASVEKKNRYTFYCIHALPDDMLFDKYTVPLAESLADLGVAIQLAMAGEPGDVPSDAHTGVQSLIEELEEDCRNLPLFRYIGDSLPDDFSSLTYEEILAQAIVNQVVLERQCALGLRPPNRTKDTEVQTDDPDADVEVDSDDCSSGVSGKRE